VVLLVSSFIGLRARSEAYNILVLKCLNHIEPNIIVFITPKFIAKLGFGFVILP
jgi:hypothetical protein